MDKILANIKHWQTTVIGILVAASAVIQSPGVQELAQLSPKIAGYIGAAGGVVATALLIFGIGPTTGAAATASK